MTLPVVVKKEDFGEEGEKGEEERDPSGIAEGGWKEGEKEGDTSSTRGTVYTNSCM